MTIRCSIVFAVSAPQCVGPTLISGTLMWSDDSLLRPRILRDGCAREAAAAGSPGMVGIVLRMASDPTILSTSASFRALIGFGVTIILALGTVLVSGQRWIVGTMDSQRREILADAERQAYRIEVDITQQVHLVENRLRDVEIAATRNEQRLNGMDRRFDRVENTCESTYRDLLKELQRRLAPPPPAGKGKKREQNFETTYSDFYRIDAIGGCQCGRLYDRCVVDSRHGL